MTITLTPDIEAAVAEKAHQQGTSPEALAVDSLRAMFVPKPEHQSVALIEPRDEWERRLRSAASPAGVSLTDEQVSSEGIYQDYE